MNKDVILTGLRANKDLHIGNYFGALLPIVDMAKNHTGKFQINLFVPDLHSITTPVDYKSLQSQVFNNLKIYAAAGLPLNSPDIYIYRQSYIPAHSELTWILDCFTGVGALRRMTQFKEKTGITSQRASQIARDIRAIIDKDQGLSTPERELTILDFVQSKIEEVMGGASAGLFTYPVLMASDILLYGAKYVPVGDDQTQHLEFARDIAGRINRQFGELFTVPEPVAKQHEFFGKDQGLRIRDLVDPSKKMSKSDESSKGVIFMGDNPEEAADKIRSATTDSEAVVGQPDFESRPGVANLLQILRLLQPATEDVSQMAYKEFKEKVALSVKNFLTDFQAKLSAVDEGEIRQKLQIGETQMSKMANETLLKVQKAIGLR